MIPSRPTDQDTSRELVPGDINSPLTDELVGVGERRGTNWTPDLQSDRRLGDEVSDEGE